MLPDGENREALRRKVQGHGKSAADSASSLLSDEAAAVFSKNVEISNLYETVWCEKYRTTFVHEYRKPLVILP